MTGWKEEGVLTAPKGSTIVFHEYKVPNATSVVLYLHGLPGGSLTSLTDIPAEMNKLGLACVSFNYPGLWDAEGLFETGDVIDASETILNHLSKKYSSIVLFGESFGGLVAVHLVSRNLHLVDKVVLRSPLLDVQPILRFLPQTLQYLKDAGILQGNPNINDLMKLNPILHLPKTAEIPFWGVIGKNDEVLPGQAMHNASTSFSHVNLELWHDFPHNSIPCQIWAQFMEQVVHFLG